MCEIKWGKVSQKRNISDIGNMIYTSVLKNCKANKRQSVEFDTNKRFYNIDVWKLVFLDNRGVLKYSCVFGFLIAYEPNQRKESSHDLLDR